MKSMKFVNLAIFALFFGLALIEAIQNRNWAAAGLFLALGAFSLWTDLRSPE